MQSSTVLLLTLGATSNAVSTAASLQQEHRDLSDITYSQTDEHATALLARHSVISRIIDSTNADEDAVVDWWMRTQSRDNLLGNFTMAGSAYAYSKKYFWVQVYATGSSEECDTA
ncbi:unnamed protein product [Peronospora destructor]|uniref:SCP domain-containing protein n=1 Tax=Peronospora destructor TaxID=86335 RepID=A0AAV0V9I2_9STRA|nr:unnamed protein product [Peronospora destructor]